jgi:hypothetical protein
MRAQFAIGFAMLVFCAGSAIAEISANRRTELLEMRRTNPRFDVRYFTQEEKEFLLHEERMDFGKDNDMLVRLGDEEMVARYVAAVNGGDNQRGKELVMNGSPELIPQIIPALMANEKFGWYGSDVKGLPKSFYIPGFILGILKGSPAFRREVIEWADALQPETDQQVIEQREIVREWWRENERFFKEHNYQAVKPGRELVKEEPRVEQPPAPAAAIASSPAKPLSQPSASPSVAQSSAPSSALLVTGAAIAIAALIGLIFFWKRRA